MPSGPCRSRRTSCLALADAYVRAVRRATTQRELATLMEAVTACPRHAIPAPLSGRRSHWRDDL